MEEYLLHEDVWMSDGIKKVAMNLQSKLNVCELSKHIINDHLKNKDHKHNYTEEDVLNTIKKIVANPISPFEVKVVKNDWGNYHIVKYCVRTSLNDTTDISIVVGSKQNIVTAWLNSKHDKHYTLDRSRYYRPER